MIGKWTKWMSRQKFEMPRASFELIKFSCSRLFNLKPYGVINKGNSSLSVDKNQWDFCGKKEKAKARQFRNWRVPKVYKVMTCNQSIPFKMRNLPNAYKAWLLSTRNAGEFVGVLPMWCLGAPSISQNSCLKRINSVFYVLIILFTNFLPLCLGFPLHI